MTPRYIIPVFAIALFGRRADYRFDAAETGLPVVYPSGSE
jgi:hypothetical protein